jgi:hypothetical protein
LKSIDPTQSTDGQPHLSRSARWNLRLAFSFILLAAAGWLAQHPYRGIVHDALLYAMLALNWLDPSAYENDLFIKHGSQGEYTVFTPLYALAIEWLGLDKATRFLLIAGHLLWTGSAAVLMWRLLPKVVALPALVFLFTLSPSYGPFNLLSVGEPFLTPRVFAESFGLLTLWALLGRQWTLAACVIAVSTVLHPIMALGPAMIAVLLALTERRLAAIAIGGSITLAAVVLFLKPELAITLVTQMDPEWRSIVYERSRMIFPTSWQYIDLLRVFQTLLLMVISASVLSHRSRSLYLATSAATVLGMIMSLIGADILGSVLLLQLQPWRVLWVANILSLAGTALILYHLCFSKSVNRRILHRFGWMLTLSLALSPFASFPIVAILAVLLWFDHKFGGERPYSPLLTFTATGTALLFLMLTAGYIIWFHVWSLGTVLRSETITLTTLMPIVVVSVILLATWSVCAPNTTRSVMNSLAGLFLAVLALLSWDRRDDWTSFNDAAPELASRMGIEIPRGSTVYWDGPINAVWFGLRTASYFNRSQHSGVVFNRPTAIEFEERALAISKLDNTAPFTFSRKRILDRNWQILAADVLEFCREPDSPSHLVFTRQIEDLPFSIWTAPVTMKERHASSADGGRLLPNSSVREVRDFYIYDCRGLAASKHIDN